MIGSRICNSVLSETRSVLSCARAGPRARAVASAVVASPASRVFRIGAILRKRVVEPCEGPIGARAPWSHQAGSMRSRPRLDVLRALRRRPGLFGGSRRLLAEVVVIAIAEPGHVVADRLRG